MKAIADTGFLVALANRRDMNHDWAVEIANAITEPALTCDAVLAEATYHLGDARVTLGFIEDGLVRAEFSIDEHSQRLRELAQRYADRKPDLADLCLIKMSELNPKLPVITTDLADFRVYRRGRREAIALLHPPR